jgi:hypothetical protein
MCGAVQSGAGYVSTEFSKFSIPVGREGHDLRNLHMRRLLEREHKPSGWQGESTGVVSEMPMDPI